MPDVGTPRPQNLCFNKSKESGIRAARLPIGTYLSELKTRKVLTVNQTFEILLKWVETRDWEQALYSVIPPRKFHEKRRRGKGDSKEGSVVPENAVVLDADALEDDIEGHELADETDDEEEAAVAMHTDSKEEVVKQSIAS